MTTDTIPMVFHSIREEPFAIYGLYAPKTESIFRRMPEITAQAVSDRVAKLSREPSGGCVRFSTNSAKIQVHVYLTEIYHHSETSAQMAAGMDLYEDTDAISRYVGSFTPPYTLPEEYEVVRQFPERKMRSFTLYLPIRAVVSEIMIGLEADAVLAHGRSYADDRPVVVYGSSIVHGVSASRCGLIYTNLLARHLDRPVTNLGFAGAALGEETMMRYLAGLDMSVFVYDYDHNARSVESLNNTHKRGHEIIREAHPHVPILMITRPNASTNPREATERKAVIWNSYCSACAAGDRNVYYIDGESFFRGKYEYECTTDCVHPNDIGYMLMAEGIEAEVRKALSRCEI